MVYRHYESTEQNNFNVLMVFLHLESLWASQYDIIQLGTINLDNSLTQLLILIELSCHIKSPIFIMMPTQLHQNFTLSGYLSPPTNVPPHYRVTVFARVPYTFIIHENSIFDLNSRQWFSRDLNLDLPHRKLLK